MHSFTIALIVAMSATSNQAAPGAVSPSASFEIITGQLKAEFAGRELLVSFRITDAFPKETREAIASGLEVEFLHFFEVTRRRSLWFDRTLVRKTVRATAAYDSLTRQYRLGRQVDGQAPQNAMALTEDEMIAWMTSIEQFPLSGTSELPGIADGSLYVRVKSRIRRRFLLWFIPWDVETDWEKVSLGPPKKAEDSGC